MHSLFPTRLRATFAGLALTGLIVTTTACSGSSKATPAASSRTDAATTTTDSRNGLHFALKPTTMVGTGGAATLSARDTDLARSLTKRYVELGMWEALRRGSVGADFATLFTTEAQGRLAPGSQDRVVVTDEGSKAATSRLDSTITLHAISDPSGTVAVIAAEIDAVARSGPASTTRTGELLLVPSGKAWRIGGYQLTVVRNPGNGTASTSTTAKATP